MARQSALSIYLSAPEIRPGLVVAGRVLWYLARPARALMKLRQSGRFWARSSAVEHYLDMVGVTGSIPVVPTKILKALTCGGRVASPAAQGFFFPRCCIATLLVYWFRDRPWVLNGNKLGTPIIALALLWLTLTQRLGGSGFVASLVDALIFGALTKQHKIRCRDAA